MPGHHSYIDGVTIEDDPHPQLQSILDFASIEVELRVECDMYQGYAGSYIQPPEDPEASLVGVKVADINYGVHERFVNGDLMLKFLVTPDVLKIIEAVAIKRFENEWDDLNSGRQDRAWESFESYWMDAPDND